MSSLQINSLYPVDYFTLAGVDEIQYPDTLWWSSKQRYSSVDSNGNFLSVTEGGTPTSEYLELDLGRQREVNFVNFTALRVPMDITIEYDSTSLGDGSHEWVAVQRLTNMPFDESLFYDANTKNAWADSYFYFDDAKGEIAHTRYLRIGFHRREDAWPVDSADPFPYPAMVEKMRVGRYISERMDTAGPLLHYIPTSPTQITLPTNDDNTTREIRQQFVIPSNAVRGTIVPALLGAGILIYTTATIGLTEDELPLTEPSFAWSLWDVTDSSTPALLRGGVETGVVNTGETWLDFYFEAPLVGSTSTVYELRVKSLNALVSNIAYVSTPNLLSNTAIPGTLSFTNGSTSVTTSVDTTSVVKVGSYIQKQDTPDQVYLVTGVNATTITLNTPFSAPTAANVSAAVVYPSSIYDTVAQGYVQNGSKVATIRVWADVADEGRDVLGNAYRYATHVDEPKYVFDGTRAGWMSAPQPAPDAVEALYFDVRNKDTSGNPIYSVLDAIRVAPRTPGVQMHVYYSQEGLRSDGPTTTDEWDNILWTPVNTTYILRNDAAYVLPQPIQAAYIKLEFTSLVPLPFKVPNYPKLPPVEYRRYPTWVEQQFDNPNLRQVVNDWFLRNATTVQTQVLNSIANPTLEFQYKEQEFLAALALGQIKDAQIVNSGLVDIANKALIDPTTAQKIYVSTPSDYQGALLLSVDQSSVLGQVVVNRYDPKVVTQPYEAPAPAPTNTTPYVSTTNDRVGEAYQNMATLPMWFNRTCRHIYRVVEAEFNKKAYFVGIDEVQFLKAKYTALHDDKIIADEMYNDDRTTENSWFRENTTEITDGQYVYVSYQIGDTTVIDEAVALEAYTQKPLSLGGAPARNIQVYANASYLGQQFFQPDDYTLGYTTDANGITHTTIGRSSDTARLTVPKQTIPYVDVGTVVGHGVIPQQPTLDAGTAVGVAGLTAIASTVEGPFVPDYGAGVEGGGTYANLTSRYIDTGTTAAVGKASPSDAPIWNDAATAKGIAVVTATGSYNGVGPNP